MNIIHIVQLMMQMMILKLIQGIKGHMNKGHSQKKN